MRDRARAARAWFVLPTAAMVARVLLPCAVALAACARSPASIGGDAPDAAPVTDALAGASRCHEEADDLVCSHETRILLTGYVGWAPRAVRYQVPLGVAPAAGWPVALVFQGSFFSAAHSWRGARGAPFNGHAQVRLTQELLDRGIAVVTPEAHVAGTTFWDTNVPPFATAWELSADHQLMVDLFAAIEAGELGPLDGDRMFATGISSGGYMSSRMAVSYPGRFAALAIHSASYATCSGALCAIPPLPADHPPTLFLTGRADPIVPVGTVERYAAALAPIAPVELLVDDTATHEWLAVAPGAITAWFLAR